MLMADFPYLQDMFEKVNKAYEFLCTKSAKVIDGPDPENIILILKTQSILFNRHKEGKYATSVFYVHFLVVISVNFNLLSSLCSVDMASDLPQHYVAMVYSFKIGLLP